MVVVVLDQFEQTILTFTRTDLAGQPVHVIDNGRTQVSVAPGFSGAITAWSDQQGVNHLQSPFPEVKTFGWMSPWYGGVTPLAIKPRSDGDFPCKLYGEALSAEVVDAPDARGIPWRGVRVQGQMVREDMVGLAVQLDYLTVPHSHVLKLVYRVANQTTSPRTLGAGWLVFAQPGASAGRHTLRSANVERKDTPWNTWSVAGEWATVTNPQNGQTMAMVSPYPRVWLMDWGDATGFLAWMDTVEVPPSGAAQRVCYLALCPDPQRARRYAWLAKYI